MKKNVFRESAQWFIELDDAIDLFWNAFYSTYMFTSFSGIKRFTLSLKKKKNHSTVEFSSSNSTQQAWTQQQQQNMALIYMD